MTADSLTEVEVGMELMVELMKGKLVNWASFVLYREFLSGLRVEWELSNDSDP